MKTFKGLTAQEVEESKRLYGTNTLKKKEPASMWEMFVDSLKDQWLMILIGALIIQVIKNTLASFFPALFGSPDWLDPISIFIAVLLSSGFATISGYKQEKLFLDLSAESDKKMIAHTYRDGKLKEIPVDDLVKGDVIKVQTGDKIPVDGILLDGQLKVDQASVNGESEEANKIPLGDNEEPSSDDLFTELRVFRGTSVVSGEAVIKATVIGDKTIMGGINDALQEEEKPSPSEEKLGVLAQGIGKLGYTSAGLYFAIVLISTFMTSAKVFFGLSTSLAFFIQTVLYSVTLVIMAVPEGLPMMLAMVASMNAGLLLKLNILIRKPKSIEVAGQMNLLATDKTGTLTYGILSVVDFITGSGKVFNTTNSGHGEEYKNLTPNIKDEIIKAIGLNNDSFVAEDEEKGTKYAAGGNNTDKALMNFLIQEDKIGFTEEIVEKEQFDSAKKFATVTLSDGTKYVKGAPEILLPTTKYYLEEDGTKVEMTQETLDNLDKVSLEQAERSMRLIAILKEENQERTLISLVCIRDNVRKEIPETVKELNGAGIKVLMITGDRKETAIAIAKESGIITSDKDVALTHDEMAALSDDELKEIIPNLKVVSRALPMDKKRLVNLAQDLNLVVGMTGDGVNDAPALKSADVGFAMGDGTQTAQDASDIVILNNSLTSISKAILYGRTMTKSVQKFLNFQLTVNVSTIALSLLAIFLNVKEVFPVVFILWINLIMDTLAALMFGEEPALSKYMKEQPLAKKDPMLTKQMKVSIGVISAYITIVSLGIMANLFGVHDFITNGTGDFKMVETFYMTFFIYAILFNSLNTRSTGFNLLEHINQNMKFLYILVAIAIGQTAILYFGGAVFGTVPMDIEHYIAAIVLGLLVIPVDFIRKALTKSK